MPEYFRSFPVKDESACRRYSLAKLRLDTGRTHQIRVHMKYIGHPLPGDFLYNPDYSCISRQALVRRGEEANIFPFQEQADVMFNSALIYELAVLKQYAEPEATLFLAIFFIILIIPVFLVKRCIPISWISTTRILREFIGGGCFRI